MGNDGPVNRIVYMVSKTRLPKGSWLWVENGRLVDIPIGLLAWHDAVVMSCVEVGDGTYVSALMPSASSTSEDIEAVLKAPKDKNAYRLFPGFGHKKKQDDEEEEEPSRWEMM